MKRSNGEGSIQQLPNGKWRGRVSTGGRRVSFTADKKEDVSRWIRKTSRQVEQGLTYTGNKTTVNDLMTSWLQIKGTKTRPATIESYNRLAHLYIQPAIGNMRLKDLTAARVQTFYNDLLMQGKGKRTIELVHVILHGLLNHAHNLGLIVSNWSERVEVPRAESREMSVWDESQVSHFLQFVNGDPFYRLAFSTGMRRGELIGLQWKDLDWQTGIIQVRRQVCEPEGGGWVFQPPKTERGRRGIRLGPGLIESLRTHFTEVIPGMISIAGVDYWQENDLVFPSPTGKPFLGYSVTKRFKHLEKLAGLPGIRFHDIRHTAASIMLLHGEPPVRVAAILGQSVMVLMTTYAHYIPDDQERASALMDAITSPAMIRLDQSAGNAMARQSFSNDWTQIGHNIENEKINIAKMGRK